MTEETENILLPGFEALLKHSRLRFLQLRESRKKKDGFGIRDNLPMYFRFGALGLALNKAIGFDAVHELTNCW